MHIVFVCTGNTCRSPMAAFLLQQKLQQKGLSWTVTSAGLFAAPGMPMSKHAVGALDELGINGSAHYSQQLSPELIASASYVFTMTAGHRADLLAHFPEFSSKIHQLAKFAMGADTDSENAGRYDIVDPFGGSKQEYKQCAAELNKYIDLLIDRLNGTGPDTGTK
ncbi:low molecular weight protein arginine phosphatase [Alicyclobacillus sp. SO9]|uniref:low molecular weight protein arginine phosphatase n=1 Tax=Alicyclobacillus sp. SO9 TaxID=2665646 RepID=UPI0018E88D6F|nr:low molecular weight protein arginine phosphatase [Alicyclobacillus sp. SO9]QQE78803.1 low molecular weight protein arginine phosphatase [Alicyclobacillus sp. SO9]